MFHGLKGCLKLRNTTDKNAPYFPCRYLRRMLVAYMANNRDIMWKHKEASLMGRYGLEGGDDCPEPISYKEYLTKMLKRGQWGGLYNITCLCLSVQCKDNSGECA